MTVVRNPFPPVVHEEINKIVEPAVRQIRKNISVRYVRNAATFISSEALKNRKQLSEYDFDKAENNTNLKDFEDYLKSINSKAKDQLIEIIKRVYINSDIRQSGSFLYPDTGLSLIHI